MSIVLLLDVSEIIDSFYIEYARAALRHYNELLPHFDLNAGVKEAMKGQK